MKITANLQYLQQKYKPSKDKQDASLKLANQDKKEEKKSTLKYKLVGTSVKIMLVENGVEVSCLKSIPVEKASPEIITKIENLSFLDLVMISELKNKELCKEDTNTKLPKEHQKYEDHSVYVQSE